MLQDGAVSPLFNGIPKSKGMGKKQVYPIYSKDWNASSRDSEVAFGLEEANDSSGRDPVFQQDLVENFGYRILDRQVLLATNSTNSGTFFKDMQIKVNECVGRLEEDIVAKFYGGLTGGALGKVESITGAVITLEGATAKMNSFSVGQELNFGLAALTTQRFSSGTNTKFKITAVDRATYKITVSAIGDVVVDDLVFKSGDFAVAKKTGAKVSVGLSDFINPPVATNFLGLNTDNDSDRLRGHIQAKNTTGSDDGAKAYNTILNAVATITNRFYKYRTTMIAGPTDLFYMMMKSVAFKQGVNAANFAEKDFYGINKKLDALLIATTKGTIPMVFDPSCPQRVFGIFNPALRIKYLAEGDKLVGFKSQNGSRVFNVQKNGKNNAIFQLENYTALINMLPGPFWYFDL